ncbi:hypothetical protein BDY19DRAFT_954600 [Irpex rosettiformis]|uniref:Uncharacterized protein n=1 Tax=Irpex rosettiformis TaxID=378272 RepID=A0ACB8U052_9APHY|nr:hypothetical protein BDY19DRAFT_954600 [Irpex rosettiformis]
MFSEHPYMFHFEKAEAALGYLSSSLQWLAASNTCVLRELDFKKIQRLLKQIERLQPSVSTVYNRMAPVNSLPPEILGSIFERNKDSPRLHGVEISSPSISWPVIQSVCRYWRNIAIQTPELWNYIRVTKSQLNAYGLCDLNESPVLTSIRRSSHLPLIVSIASAPYLENKQAGCIALASDLKPYTSRIHELHMRGDLVPNVLDLFASDGGEHSLEYLSVVDIGLGYYDSREFVRFRKWRVLYLHTLHVDAYSGWGGAPFTTLRHLLIRNQDFNSIKDLRRLHRVLSKNPHLEDFVLESCYVNPEMDSGFETLPRLNMPYLKHIVVKAQDAEDDIYLIIQLIERKLVLQAGHAKSYSHMNHIDLFHLFESNQELCIFPAKRLFVSHRHTVKIVVGTDDNSSFLVVTRPLSFLAKYALRPEPSQVSELWLQTRSVDYQDIIGIVTADALQGVTKLVLLTDVDRYLCSITEHSCFPLLSEIHLLISWDGLDSIGVILSNIVYCLIARRDGGHPVSKLQITLNSTVDRAAQVFESWKEYEGEFREVVFNVTFEDASDNPRRMELPKICMEGPPAQLLWKPWDNGYIENQPKLGS